MGTTVLMIEDDPHILDITAYFLESEGFTTLKAETGKKGLAILEREQVDVILLDIVMPDIDGFELCKTIKESEKTSKIPIIFVTAKGEPIDRVKGYFSEASAYIVKPFTKEDILKMVSGVLGKTWDVDTDIKGAVLQKKEISSTISTLRRFQNKLREQMFGELLRYIEMFKRRHDCEVEAEIVVQRAINEVLSRDYIARIDRVERLIEELGALARSKKQP